jgi:hypothetical protein
MAVAKPRLLRGSCGINIRWLATVADIIAAAKYHIVPYLEDETYVKFGFSSHSTACFRPENEREDYGK